MADDQLIRQTLDALERLMRMFQFERVLYLLCALVSFCLLMYAGYLMISANLDIKTLGIMFGATGLVGVSAARIAYFLNRAFDLIEALVRQLAGINQ